MPRWAFWLGVALIFVGGLALRTQTFTELWTGVHNAWGGAFYGNVARNFLRYGYWATAFAPVVNTGVVDPSQFEIYYHHPPLSIWLTSVSFHVFGVHEWSARLPPLVFSLLTMGLVFAFAKAAYGKATALCALLFIAVLPVEAYYATHVDTNSSASIFLTTLAVEAYRRWLIGGRDRDYFLCVVSVVFGCMTAWYTYLVIPPIFAHFWLIHRPTQSRAMRARIWLLPAVAVLVFGLFLLHREIALAGRAEVYDALADRVLKRTTQHGVDLIVIIKTYVRQILTGYTLPFVGLTAAWIFLFLADLRKRRMQLADWCIAILLSYGFLYALAFPGHLLAHDFFVRPYAPGVALASALVVVRAAGALQRRLLRLAALGVVVGGVCALGTASTLRLYAADDRSNGHILQGFGEVVAALTAPSDAVFLPIREDRVLQYYLDRPITFGLDTPDKLEAAAAKAITPYLILVPERHAKMFPELLAYLKTRYSERREKGLIVYSNGGKRPGT
ncbi:MAG: glycosyltransferase family 39 protein [Pseudomonadota bacterium]|nr:glycosyltransferase family 39 protein [Pseudomonadota bacterium]